MKVKSIEINGIGGIDSLHIDFNEGMNFICGPNGIGKTTLLECVAHSFSNSSTNVLKRNVSAVQGNFSATIDIDGKDILVLWFYIRNNLCDRTRSDWQFTSARSSSGFVQSEKFYMKLGQTSNSTLAFIYI